METKRYCFCCGKVLKGKIFLVDCLDDQKGLEVGPDCYKHIVEQAKYAKANNIENPGYMPRSGGPSLIPHEEK